MLNSFFFRHDRRQRIVRQSDKYDARFRVIEFRRREEKTSPGSSLTCVESAIFPRRSRRRDATEKRLRLVKTLQLVAGGSSTRAPDRLAPVEVHPALSCILRSCDQAGPRCRTTAIIYHAIPPLSPPCDLHILRKLKRNARSRCRVYLRFSYARI